MVLKDSRRIGVRTISGMEQEWSARRQMSEMGHVLGHGRAAAWERLNRSVDRVTGAVGSLWAVTGATLVLVAWVITGPVLQFSDEGQLFINTTTTVLTFGSVLVIQGKHRPQSHVGVGPTPALQAPDSPETT